MLHVVTFSSGSWPVALFKYSPVVYGLPILLYMLIIKYPFVRPITYPSWEFVNLRLALTLVSISPIMATPKITLVSKSHVPLYKETNDMLEIKEIQHGVADVVQDLGVKAKGDSSHFLGGSILSIGHHRY